jgi:DNA-binding transcriptional ArsR family regulator
MDKFYALSAPIRREIIAMLSDGEQLPATAIAERFQISAPAISQHLKVLLNSKLVQMHKQAQQRIYELNPAAMLELEAWAQQIVTNLDAVGAITRKQDANTSLKEAS